MNLHIFSKQQRHKLSTLFFPGGNITTEKDPTFGGGLVSTGLNEVGSSNMGGASTCLPKSKSKKFIQQ